MDLPGISDGFRRLRRHTEAAGDMSAAAQDVRARQYERVCENFRILRRKYDSLKEVHQALLWGDAVLAHEGLAAGLPAVDPTLVEEAHRVGDVTTAATLGSGACSSVLEGAWPDGRPCAVKRISKRDAKTLQEVRNVASELEALRALTGAPHALELQAAFASRDHLYFVVERFGEELYALLKRDACALAPAQQAGVVHGVAAGLAHMHSLDLVHRDVKPENVLLADVVPGGGFRDVRVKLCDLGLSTRVRAAPSPACATATLALGGRAAPPRAARAALPVLRVHGLLRAGHARPGGLRRLRRGRLEPRLPRARARGGRAALRVWFREYKAFFARRGDRDGEHGRFVANLAPLARALRGCGELAAEPDVARDLEDCRVLCRQSPAFAGASACLDADPAARRTPAEARDASRRRTRGALDAPATAASAPRAPGGRACGRAAVARELAPGRARRPQASSPVAPAAPRRRGGARRPRARGAARGARARERPAAPRRRRRAGEPPGDARRAPRGLRLPRRRGAEPALDARIGAYDAVLVELGLGAPAARPSSPPPATAPTATGPSSPPSRGAGRARTPPTSARTSSRARPSTPRSSAARTSGERPTQKTSTSSTIQNRPPTAFGPRQIRWSTPRQHHFPGIS
ncbi:serine/threonine kinase [Aureococcus anophagefferens]|nr:serine/threonine kinase [Aureococcus anophagefferens]